MVYVTQLHVGITAVTWLTIIYAGLWNHKAYTTWQPGNLSDLTRKSFWFAAKTRSNCAYTDTSKFWLMMMSSHLQFRSMCLHHQVQNAWVSLKNNFKQCNKSSSPMGENSQKPPFFWYWQPTVILLLNNPRFLDGWWLIPKSEYHSQNTDTKINLDSLGKSYNTFESMVKSQKTFRH